MLHSCIDPICHAPLHLKRLKMLRGNARWPFGSWFDNPEQQEGREPLPGSQFCFACCVPSHHSGSRARQRCRSLVLVQTSQECETALTSQIWSIMETDRRSVRGSVKESIKGSAIRPVICIVMRSVTELIFSIQSCHEVSKITQLS